MRGSGAPHGSEESRTAQDQIPLSAFLLTKTDVETGWRMAANGADQREPSYTSKTSFKQGHMSPVPLCMSSVNRQHKGHVTVPQRRRFTVDRSPSRGEKLRRWLRSHPSSVTRANLDAEKQRSGTRRPPPSGPPRLPGTKT